MNFNRPLLSVITITYNHEKYIITAIESILNQKVNFKYELIIGDDCSDDLTQHICNEYAQKNPDKIIVMPAIDHIGMMPNFIRTLKEANGKYIAICEGDDYWTDPYKLQKQVDSLEANPEYSLCFHNALKLYQNEEREPELFGQYEKQDYSQRDIIHEWLIPTASVVFRNVFLDRKVPEHFYTAPIGDFPLFLYLGEFGKYHYLDETMSVYRVLSTGAVKTSLASEKYYLMSRELSKSLAAYYQPRFRLDFAIRVAFDNYCLARFAARKGERGKALSFLLESMRADPLMMFRNRERYKYITLRRLLPKIIRDIIRG